VTPRAFAETCERLGDLAGAQCWRCHQQIMGRPSNIPSSAPVWSVDALGPVENVEGERRLSTALQERLKADKTFRAANFT
jgi:hypothetical protein